MTTAEPIGDAELGGLFTRTLTVPSALAVSGGADSMALMLLFARWMRLAGYSHTLADGRDSVIVLTVDHRLRANSTDEARWVKGEAERLGFRHEILSWQSRKPATGLQAAAREARYRMMSDYLLQERASSEQFGGSVASDRISDRIVVTAHHEDDQAETLLMRLARGSGVDGLSGMSQRSSSFGLTIVRPLLGVPKARLLATLRAAGQHWCEDPSNENEQFERVRLRASKADLENLGLTNSQLALSARRLHRAREALNAATDELSQRAKLDLHRGAYASLDQRVLNDASEELRVRIISRLLFRFGGQETAPRLSKVEELCSVLLLKPMHTATLGGCIVVADEDKLNVFREPGREGLPEITLCRGEKSVWDRRFWVSLSADGACPDEVAVAALGAADLAARREQLSVQGLPYRALLTLPAFRSGGRLLAVPHLTSTIAGCALPCFGVHALFGGLDGADLDVWPET